MCALSETLLNNSIPTAFVEITGHSFERRDRGLSGGGVGVYLKNRLVYCRRNDLEAPEIEVICLEIIKTRKTVSRLCAPPNSSKQFKKNFETFLSKVTNEKKDKRSGYRW